MSDDADELRKLREAAAMDSPATKLNNVRSMLTEIVASPSSAAPEPVQADDDAPDDTAE